MGRVSVDGETVTEQGRRVDPETAVVRVDGLRITTSSGAVHLALLVRRDRLSDFEQAVDSLGDDWDSRVSLRLIGPVAPYCCSRPRTASADGCGPIASTASPSPAGSS